MDPTKLASPRMINTRAMLRRQSTPGAIVLIVMALIVFGPKLLDVYRGHPWIESKLIVVELTNGRLVVEDTTYTTGSASGVRANTVESDVGEILCAYNHYNTWLGERKRNWTMEAFSACAVPKQPFRVCSRFHVESDHGRRGSFGPYCSQIYGPQEES